MPTCLSKSDPEKCQGFNDRARMSLGGPEHYTEQIHEEDCPCHPERMAEALAEYEQERWEIEELERQRDEPDLDWNDLD